MTTNKKELLDTTLVSQLNDAAFYKLMHELPDPDILLRKAGVDAEIYKDIMQDAHVMGEVRQQYSALLSYKYEIVPGDDSAQANAAKELCESIFKRRPHRTMRWNDLFWSMGKAPLFGRRVHLVNWELNNNQYVPSEIFNIRPSQYSFDFDGNLLINKSGEVKGVEAPENRFLITRHMPDAENPYGMAILSSCFWPWMFKNGGFKFFVKYCERFGLPFPIGKYSEGTSEPDINALLDSLLKLLDEGVAAIPDNQSIELLTSNSSGEMPTERLIVRCNMEMSKAISSQTAASELQKNSGSRAATETHQGRTDKNAMADRELVTDTANQLFEIMTMLNFSEGTAPPKFSYIDKKQLNKDDVEYMDAATKLVPVKRADIYSRLNLTEPQDTDDVVFNPVISKDQSSLLDPAMPSKDRTSKNFANFAETDKEWRLIDQTISDIVAQVKLAIDSGTTLEQAIDAIIKLMPELDENELNNIVKQELELEFGQGMLEES
jgi:phage gp29-like protein